MLTQILYNKLLWSPSSHVQTDNFTENKQLPHAVQFSHWIAAAEVLLQRSFIFVLIYFFKLQEFETDKQIVAAAVHFPEMS